MTFRNIDGSGDWTFGQGRQNYLRDQNAVAANIATRLRSYLNDCFWALDAGVDWWNLLGTTNPTAQTNIIIQTRAVLANSFGVIRINSVVATTDRATRRMSLTYNVDTIFTRNLVGTVQP
jgi:hypothetical protein